MPRKPITILAINPGIRYLGIALFEQLDLREWAVKYIRGSTSREKLKKAKAVVGVLLDRYEPDILVLKQLHPSRSSANLNRLVGAIKQAAKLRRIKLRQYSIKQVKAFYWPKRRTNKKKLADTLASRYPALAHDLARELANKHPYYIRMFEAVALGAICSQQH